MDAPKTQRAGRRQAPIRTSEPNQKRANSLRLRGLTNVSDEPVDKTQGNSSGLAAFEFETGPFTYRKITWAIRCTAAIADVTMERQGVHYIKRQLLKNYIGEVRLIPNNNPLQELTMGELEIRNLHNDIAFGPIFSGFAFPGEHTYEDKTLTDAYALGTEGMRSLRLTMKINDANFDADTMEIVVLPHFVRESRPTGFTIKTETTTHNFPSVGKHTYRALSIGDDIKDLWIQGDGIRHIKMEIDGDLLFDWDYAQYEAFMVGNGKVVGALDGGWFIDMHAEGAPRSIAALDRPNERRKDANVKLTITTTQASTDVRFILTTADLYGAIR